MRNGNPTPSSDINKSFTKPHRPREVSVVHIQAARHSLTVWAGWIFGKDVWYPSSYLILTWHIEEIFLKLIPEWVWTWAMQTFHHLGHQNGIRRAAFVGTTMPRISAAPEILAARRGGRKCTVSGFEPKFSSKGTEIDEITEFYLVLRASYYIFYIIPSAPNTLWEGV